MARRSPPSSRPGIRVPTLAHTVGRLRPSVVRDLDLKRHGLSLVGPDVRVFAPSLDGQAIVLWGDPARTAEGLRTTIGARRRPLRRVRPSRSLAGRLPRRDRRPRPRPTSSRPGLTDALAGLRLGRTFRGLGRHDGRTITRVLPMAVADFVAESFETDALRAAIAWRGIQYTAMGPWSAGTTAVLLGDSAGNDGGAAGQTVFARGGPGALVKALESAAREAGVEIRTGAEVVAITSSDGRATGVVLADGDELSARAVVAGIDPKRTLTRLADPVAIGPSLLWRAGNIRTPGTVAKVNLALSGLPSFTAAGDDPRLVRGPDRHRAGHRRDGAGARRRQVRPAVRDADHGGHDPVAGRPDARRGRARRQPRHERHRRRDAAHACATDRGTSGARRWAIGSSRRSTPTRRAWRRWSPRARSSLRSTSSATTA